MDDAPLAWLSKTPEPQPAELRALRALGDAGLPVAPILLLQARAEEDFYRSNNLEAQLQRLFVGVDPLDADEDDLEELAAAAVGLLEGHYLLDELIDRFYEALSALPPRVRVRRPGEDGVEAARGRPSLLAVKALWAREWSFEALAERLPRSGRLLPEMQPLLLHDAALEPLPPSLALDAAALLGRPVRLRGGPHGIGRLEFGAPGTAAGPLEDAGR